MSSFRPEKNDRLCKKSMHLDTYSASNAGVIQFGVHIM